MKPQSSQRKSPHTFDGRGPDNTGRRANVTRLKIRGRLPWRNPMPLPHLYMWFAGTGTRSLRIGGREAQLMQRLLNGGVCRWEWPHLRQLVYRMKKRHGVVVSWRWERLYGRRHKRYFLKARVSHVMEVRDGAA